MMKYGYFSFSFISALFPVWPSRVVFSPKPDGFRGSHLNRFCLCSTPPVNSNNTYHRLILFLCVIAFCGAPPLAAENGFGLTLGRMGFSLDSGIMENGIQTDFSLNYRYTEAADGELRISYLKESYDRRLYEDIEESLAVNHEQTVSVFLLPFRYRFFDDPLFSLNAAGGAYYRYNSLKQSGYFNMADLDAESLNMYSNDFSMHLLGPLVEAGLLLHTDEVNIAFNAGIVPVFYLGRDQSMRVKPYMGDAAFNYSQNTDGSPYFYVKLGGTFFEFLDVNFLYEYTRINYDVIGIDGGRNWTTPESEVVTRIFDIEASVLVPVG
ncbi:MAG: hypothetical protein LBF77_03440, partial [Spirochaetaceae bacterium]|nr:hypothetical protein [Spirochaetaceae bacterium]